MELPLAGVRVVELGRLVAAPLAAQMLGDLGADVIKVERPQGGDMVRTSGQSAERVGTDGVGINATFLSVNRNKRSVAIDYTSEQGRAQARALVATADVLIENFRVGRLARFGLDAPTLLGRHPELVYCSITGYGQTGPYRDLPGLDPAIQALSGLMSLTGEPDGPPHRVGLYLADILAGQQAAFAVAAALAGAPGARRGGHIDVSLLDSMVAALSHRLQEFLLTGTVPPRLGAAATPVPVTEPVTCADGQLVVFAAKDDDFRRLCEVIGAPQLARDPRFVTQVARTRHRSVLMPLIDTRTTTATMSHWRSLFEDLGLVCAPVNDMGQLTHDPQVRHRGMQTPIDHPTLGRIDLVASPLRFAGAPTPVGIPPRLGEHTDEVLAELDPRNP